MVERGEHPYLANLKEHFAEGRIDRRDFLRTATLLGLSAGRRLRLRLPGDGPSAGPQRRGRQCAEAAICASAPSCSRSIPHTFEWNSQANVSSQVCQYLARTGHDNLTRPFLLELLGSERRLADLDAARPQGRALAERSPFTADDAIWNLRHVLDPETGSSVMGLMKGYMLPEEEDDSGAKRTRLWDANAIERVDSHTVRLNTKAPQLAVPEHLYHYPLLMLDPDEGGIFDPGANGTGPFELVEFKVQQRALLKARTDYWGDVPLSRQHRVHRPGRRPVGRDRRARLQAGTRHRGSLRQPARCVEGGRPPAALLGNHGGHRGGAG